jgi:broad specificity phosphatase PhoE
VAVLYLVRHGESEANRRRVFDGREFGLTPLGRRQAQAVAGRLALRPIEAVYASPYRRALETAEIVAGELGRAVDVAADLQEVRVGDLAGRRDPGAHTIYKAVYARWLAGDLAAGFPGGETLGAACARVQRFLDVVAARHHGHEVVAVSHGGMPETVLPILLSLRLGVRRRVEFAAITTLRLGQRDAGWVVGAEDWGAVAHLRDIAGEGLRLRRQSPERRATRARS